MTRVWNGPTPFDNKVFPSMVCSQQQGYRAAKNDDMALYEALLSVSHGMYLTLQDPIRLALAAYEAGLEDEE